MAPVIPIWPVVGLGRGQRRGEAPAPHHLDTKRDRVGEQFLIERRGEIGRVQDPQAIGFRDAEEKFETLDLIAAFPAFGGRQGQQAEARRDQDHRGGDEQSDKEQREADSVVDREPSD
jgi:hypothetical protein